MSTTRLNVPFIRDEWLPALRSGEYKQGTGSLRDAYDRFCCLGVACDRLIQAGVLPAWEGPYPQNRYGVAYKTTYLPLEAANYIGCDAWGEFDGRDDLVRLNDIEHFTFPEIADFIEREWLGETTP